MTRRAAPRRVSPCGATSFAHGGKGGKTPPGETHIAVGNRFPPAPVRSPPDPRNLREPNSRGRLVTVRRGMDNDCPSIRDAAAAGPKSRWAGMLDQTGAPDCSGSNLCWRKLEGGSSASRIAYPSLRPAGQSSLISSLRLSNANPLRWALRWGPPAAAIVDGSASARPAPSATAGRNQARL